MSNSMEKIAKKLREKYNITPTTTFADLVKTKAEVSGDKVFLTFIRDFDKGIDEIYTFRDMDIQSNRVANALLGAGLKRGDGISLYQINSPEFLFVLFGAWKIGIYVTLVNTGLKGDGLQFIIDHSDSKLIATHWSLLDNYLRIKDKLPKIEHVLVDINEAPEDLKLPDGIITLQEFMDTSEEDTDVKNNIKVDNKYIVKYDKDGDKLDYVEAGVLILKKEVLDLIEDNKKVSLENFIF